MSIMDDDMEDEIICELFTTHVHILWRYIGVTSAGIAQMVLPGPGESFKSKMFQTGPFLMLVLSAILVSVLLQSCSSIIKSHIHHLNHVLGIDKVVSRNSLKNFVAATINADNFSEEYQEGIVGVYAMQGRRGNMEDRFSIVQNIDIGTKKKMSFYGVYDGHGGQYVAEYVKEHLFKNTIEKLRSLYLPPTDVKREVNDNNSECSSSTTCKSSAKRNSVSTSNNNESDPKSTCSTTPEEPSKNVRKLSQDKIKCEVNTANSIPVESVVNGRMADTKAPLSRKNSTDNNEKNPPQRRGSEVEDLSDISATSMKKDEPYLDRRFSTKRNSVTNQKEGNKEKKEISEDSIYFDSSQNINYTRLLTDQILTIDKKVVDHCKNCIDMSGTTAVVAVLDGEMLIIGNVGDSRAVMGDLKGLTVPLSFDHKPNQLKERRRIKEAGGFIHFSGVWRVAGILATSRALGDFPLKDPRRLVTAEPDVLTFSLKEHKAHFVILATDGLWDVVSNEEAVDFIREHIHESDYGAKSLALHAYHLGSQDNITITVLNISQLAL